MLININEKLENTHFSITFLTWFFTLSFLPLALYFRFVIGTTLVLNKNFSAYKQTAWILGIVFAIWLIWKWRFDNRLMTTNLEKYLLVFYLVACLSTVFSVNPSLSLEKLIGISAYILGIYLLLDLKRFPNVWQGIINALLITASLSSLLILISTLPWMTLYQVTPFQILSSPVYLLKILPRLPYSLGLHPSATAAYLVMILPLGFYQFFQSKKCFWKVLQAVGFFLNLSVLLLTQSRGGLLGLFLMIFTLILLYWKNLIGFIFKNKIRTTLFAVPVITFLAGIVILLSKTRGFNIGGRTLLMRYQTWLAAFKIFLEHPWLGSGLGTFGMKFIEYRNPSDLNITTIHAHNELLQISAELGILGVISLVLIFWQVIRILRQQQKTFPAYSRMILAALGGLFGTLIPDANFTSSMIVLLFLFYLVWLVPESDARPLSHKSRIYGALTLTIVLVGIGYGWNIWKIKPYEQALAAAYQNNWRGASAALRTAQERDPDNPYYLHALGFAYGQVACKTGEDFDQALTYYQKSFETYPDWGIGHANSGVLFATSGDFNNAALQMEQAVLNYPNQSFFSCLLGDYYIQQNKSGQALQSYSRCIADIPKILDSPYWQEDLYKKDLTPLVIGQVQHLLKDREDENMLLDLASLFLANNEIELADQTIQEYLLENPDHLNGNLIHLEILEISDDLSTATGKITQLLISNPRSAALWTYQGKNALESADYEEAENAFTIGYRLSAFSYRAWMLGNLYQVQGNLPKAQEFYQKILKKTFPYSGFSQNVAARWPLPGIYVDCMPKTKTYTEYYHPAYQAAENLADQDCTQAACFYQQLLLDNPSPEEALIRLKALPCYGNFKPDLCDLEVVR